MKTPIGTVRVYKISFMTKLRLPREDWERYIACIIAWQAKRGYLRFGRTKTKGEIPREKW